MEFENTEVAFDVYKMNKLIKQKYINAELTTYVIRYVKNVVTSKIP